MTTTPTTCTRRLVLGALLAASTVCVSAQSNFPDRPIKLVVPYGAGSSVDIVARLYAQRMTTILGQSVIVDNKAGGGTSIGASFVARAPADGYVLLIGSNALSIMPHLHKTDLDPMKDFVPVAPLYKTALVLLARPDYPANNLTEFVALAKANPNKITTATWGVGGSAHLVMELLKDQAGIELTHVPYKGGGVESGQAVISGETDVGFDVSFTAIPRVRNGQVKALGVFYPERVEGLPNVQTVGEAGYPGASLPGWIGVFAPAKTDQLIVQRISAASQEILKDATFLNRLKDLGSKPFIGSPELLMATMRSESGRVGQLVQHKKIKVD